MQPLLHEEGSSLRDAVRRASTTRAGERLRIEGLRGGARALLVAAAYRATPAPYVVLAAAAAEAEAIAGDLALFLGEERGGAGLERRVHAFPAWDVPAFEPVSPPAAVVHDRMRALFHLVHGRAPIVVTTPDAVMQRLLPRAVVKEAMRYLVEGDEVDVAELVRHLVDWGYLRVPVVEDVGEFSVRGGLIDVFTPLDSEPFRLELDGDRIESIRTFAPDTQRSAAPREEVVLVPVREASLADLRAPEARRAVESRAIDVEMPRLDRNAMSDALENGLFFPGVEFVAPYVYPQGLATLFDYLPADVRLWIDDPAGVESAWDATWELVQQHVRDAESARRFFAPAERFALSAREVREALRPLPAIELDPLVGLAGTAGHLRVPCYTLADLSAARAQAAAAGRDAEGERSAAPSLRPVAERIRGWSAEGRRVFLVVHGAGQRTRLHGLLAANGIDVAASGQPLPELLAESSGPPVVVEGSLSQGFRLPTEPWVFVGEEELFGERRQRRRVRKVSAADVLSSLAELKADDYVVHVDHGIGRYRGLKHMSVADIDGDFLHLEYQGGDRMYVPVDRINLVGKYIGSDGAEPALDKLGGTAWERVKAKTKAALLSMARELVEIGAKRQVLAGQSFESGDPLFQEFEARFPFDETPDQQRAIDDVLADLARDKPMDRLVCGDVGFGKTEVAMRAAFAVVMAGRQVAVLVPTTVLAQQHYDTMCKRFAGYPVRVELLSRFRAAAENKATIAGLDDGTVDVVVGTHRLLQKDVSIARLGLLVIDEEHRFGVKDKERIKALRATVDVLTLTATPIPRTLQMALTGIRDLSVIESPPVDRLAIRTYVTKADDHVIREAILRELRRGGQVFFVHNRVDSIERQAAHLRELVPEATVIVGHGQMGERRLEQVMDDFIQQRANVLVCSTIIESGLDIPRANTILINRADALGLAQLYQLRGRVGRSNVRAYAYLLIPGEHMIGTDAHKRLEALQELDELGGGFRLAAHDLEIRGAGNMLGKQQSGNITAVGFELYTQMMEEAVREVRGETVAKDVEPEIQLGFPAYIPDTYVQDVNQRLILYKRLAGYKTAAELAAIVDEMVDRFGALPPLADSLVRVMQLRRCFKDLLIVAARVRGEQIVLEFHPETPVHLDYILAVQKKLKDRVKVFPDARVGYRPLAQDADGLIAELADLCARLR
ncbi:MAG: transcription-repair coupling factor [Polyangiaceae bacterium UTPRO1]|jgi:transcription-repair coupling factor (superfamily II helicase)|nr:transcription-repair coupling factor [Myxococcales bacterium]OQY67809.1 MAG: transcription-repair coupling factor [Polyangiaceae bacterium UTPRO1]